MDRPVDLSVLGLEPGRPIDEVGVDGQRGQWGRPLVIGHERVDEPVGRPADSATRCWATSGSGARSGGDGRDEEPDERADRDRPHTPRYQAPNPGHDDESSAVPNPRATGLFVAGMCSSVAAFRPSWRAAGSTPSICRSRDALLHARREVAMCGSDGSVRASHLGQVARDLRVQPSRAGQVQGMGNWPTRMDTIGPSHSGVPAGKRSGQRASARASASSH